MNKFKRLEMVSQQMIDLTSTKRCHHFSFILYKNKILTIGSNSRKTHPTNLKHPKISSETGEDISDQKYVCSELNAINKLKNMTNINSQKCTLVNIRYDRNNNIAFSKPCMSCQKLLKRYIFKKVIWTDNFGKYNIY